MWSNLEEECVYPRIMHWRRYIVQSSPFILGNYNVATLKEDLLVDWHKEGCSRLCLQVPNLSTNQSSLPTTWNYLKYQPGNESVSHTILSQNSQKRKRKHDSIWVVVDWLMKLTHFIPTRSTWMMKYLARMYIDNVVKLHGIPKEIVSNQDPLSSPHTS